VAPIIRPPSEVASILSSGSRFTSTKFCGCSTFSFIKSISVVPPAMKRMSAPCCAVFAFPVVAIACALSFGRVS
jgi:hypothetical protein